MKNRIRPLNVKSVRKILMGGGIYRIYTHDVQRVRELNSYNNEKWRNGTHLRLRGGVSSTQRNKYLFLDEIIFCLVPSS